MKRLLLILMTAASGMMPARAEKTDSLAIGDGVPELPELPVFPVAPLELDPGFTGTGYYGADSQLRIPDMKFDVGNLRAVPGVAHIADWSGGAFYATGGRTDLVGLMGIEFGALNLTQSFGRFTVHADVNATKYGYFRGLQTAYGFGGSVTYDINDKVSISVFGSYQTGVHAISPAMAGYVSTTSFGGYVDYKAGERWGVKVGAQTYRETNGGPYRTQPIVIPYFRLNKRDVIGVDVGGILYNLLYNNRGRSLFGGHPGNPTMGPPAGGTVAVPPRID